jgi:hypothetical protein
MNHVSTVCKATHIGKDGKKSEKPIRIEVPGIMSMTIEKRNNLIQKGYWETLPLWKWWK